MPDEEYARDRRDLTLAASGDQEAFRRLVIRHQSSVLRFARTLTDSPESAEDVLQETFLTAHRRAETYRGEGSARAWLLTIARHAASHLRRTRAGAPTGMVPFEDDRPLAELGVAAGWGCAETESPEQIAYRHEQCDMLQAALESLATEDQMVLTLRDIEGFSGPEASEALGLPLNTLKTRLHRARLRLMAALHAGGIDGA